MATLASTFANVMRLPFLPRVDVGVAKLIRIHRRIQRKQADIPLIRRAFQVAGDAHQGQIRKSGEPYITHPVAVATILARLGMDTKTLAAALLHDTIEDTPYTLTRLRNDFGEEIAHLVDGVTKLEKVRFGGAAEAESTRKLILAAARDVRVLLIKLADRLHNMRTLSAKSPESQIRIATVTRDILVPLAGRLGVQVVKRELEDRVLAALQPDDYAAIDAAVTAQRPERIRYLARVQSELAPAMRRSDISARIEERPRHYASIFHHHGGGSIDSGDDPRIVLVVRGGSAECYEALCVVHSLWRPFPGRFKDFIATPKFNLYKSLHTSVLGPENKSLIVLIRTEEMHQIAEYGIAARHRLATTHAPDGCRGCWENESAALVWLQRVLQWQREAESVAFWESLRYDLADHEISVFTAGGRAVGLPPSATPVDFAYALDTSMGDRCIGARVNGRLAPLASALNDGDVVEIVLSPTLDAGPEPSWLEIVRSPRAQFQIRRHLAEQAQIDISDTTLAQGRECIDAALADRGRVLVFDPPLWTVARIMGYPSLESLYHHVVQGLVSPNDVAERLITIVDGRV